MLTKRLQPVLTDIVSEYQSAFVQGRAISDNVLITQEVLHYLKTSSAKKHCTMALKTDMSKVYDQLEWEFIRLVFQRLGFHSTWINWVMQCVGSVTYSFLINGNPKGFVKPTRGIRQGDPFSPIYLHLMQRGPIRTMWKNVNRRKVERIAYCQRKSKNKPSLIRGRYNVFCKTDKGSISELKNIIDKYGAASGQSINLQKLAITFSRKAPPELKERVKRELKIDKEGGLAKYLGLPKHFGRRKRDLFTSIVDRIHQKAVSWITKRLSGDGKMAMLKSVLSSMPSYAMTCFQLPGFLCKKIQSALTRFWWDSKPDKKKICWVSWDKLTQHKKAGGLGFWDITCFDEALFAKLSWRIINHLNCLLARVLLDKYCTTASFMENLCPTASSHGWKSIICGRDLVAKNSVWAVGNGDSVRIWQENWLSTTSARAPIGPPTKTEIDLKVCTLLNQVTKDWNKGQIQRQYEQEILAIKPSFKGATDKRIWLKHTSGEYTTKSGYYAAQEEHHLEETVIRLDPLNWHTDIWTVKTSQKLKLSYGKRRQKHFRWENNSLQGSMVWIQPA